MCQVSWTTARRQVARLALVTAVLAPVVALVLIGLIRLQHDTPEWVYWKAELIFLTVLKVAYGVTAPLSLLGALILGFRFIRGRSRGTSRAALARGLILCIALVCGLAIAEAVSARWLSWTHRSSAVPVGGLGFDGRHDSSLRFANPLQEIDLRSNFPDPPGDREIDLVVLGGSSAQGVPYDRWVSIGKIVAWKLQQAILGRPIRLDVIARAGDTLEMQHKILSNLRRRPDLLIIYSGHNEFYSRLWWARNIDHYVSDQRPARWAVLVERLEQYSPLCVLIRESADRCRIALPPPPDTTRNLIDVPNYTAIEYTTILADFRRRLELLVSHTEQVGAMPVLILPAANDAGFEPNRSFLAPTTPRAEREAFEQEFLAARKIETIDSTIAIKRYRALVARHPCFAETHYRLAHLLEQAAEWDEAYQHYIAARDLDGMPMRCLSPFQEVYSEVAARHGCILIDTQTYFHAIGRHGLLDDELFQDAMHPSLRGQIALAQGVLGALHSRHAFGWPEDSAVPIIDPAECIAHFGIDKDAWQRIALWGKGFNEIMSPLRYDTSLRSRKREASIAGAAKIDAGIAPEAVGLPNVGAPAGIPSIAKEFELAPQSPPAIMPCLTP
jgi:hypothetical protein